MEQENKQLCRRDLVDIRELFNAQLAQINVLINANDKGYNQRFENVIEATKAALASADRAVTKAEQASDKRFEGVNEFRQTLSDQASKFIIRTEFGLVVDRLEQDIKNLQLARGELMPRVEVLGLFKAIEGKFKEVSNDLASLRESRSGSQQKSVGVTQGWLLASGVVGFAILIAGTIIAFAK